MSEQIPIENIEIGSRHRKDMGDLQELADSMREMGQLQEIGVDRSGRLVFGERRLRAAKMLGWETIRAKTVDLDAIVLGEFHENTIRKAFLPMERVAIGKAVKAAMDERRGRPEKKENIEFPGTQVENSNAQSRAPQTRDLAAQRAGFGSGISFERAEQVHDRGAPELQEAVDSGKIGLREGAEIAGLPKPEQAEVASLDKERRKQELAERKRRRVVIPNPLTPEQQRKVSKVDPVNNALFHCSMAFEKFSGTPAQLAWEYFTAFPDDVWFMRERRGKIENSVFAFVDEYRKLQERKDVQGA